MTYLLAKYTLLFLLAAVLGFMLGYWFSRRNMEDVSESFEELRKANNRSDDANWDRLWSQLKAIPEPKDTDLSDLYARLDGVSKAVAQIPVPKPIDFQPLVDNLYKIESDIKAIPVPEKPAPIDLSPVMGKIEALQVAVRGIPQPEPQREIDLAPVSAQLHALDEHLKSIPQVQSVDLGPVDRRLKAIEAEIGILGKRLPFQERQERPTQHVSRDTPRKTRRDEPRILKAALYGKKDNLKLISGVGPKLENLLNQNGVFYFWQVAEWSNRDIDIMDERLDAFKGRIGRDNWVEQAGQLRRDPGAATMPSDI